MSCAAIGGILDSLLPLAIVTEEPIKKTKPSTAIRYLLIFYSYINVMKEANFNIPDLPTMNLSQS
jgi:hypothetical protein